MIPRGILAKSLKGDVLLLRSWEDRIPDVWQFIKKNEKRLQSSQAPSVWRKKELGIDMKRINIQDIKYDEGNILVSATSHFGMGLHLIINERVPTLKWISNW